MAAAIVPSIGSRLTRRYIATTSGFTPSSLPSSLIRLTDGPHRPQLARERVADLGLQGIAPGLVCRCRAAPGGVAEGLGFLGEHVAGAVDPVVGRCRAGLGHWA